MKEVLAQLCRFVGIGLLATLAHVAVAYLARSAAGIGPYQANLAGYAAAFSISYLGNFHWTFSLRGSHGRHLVRFAAVSLLGLGITTLIIHAVTTLGGLDYAFAMLAILAIVPPFNFVLSRTWAFRPHRLGPGQDRWT
jgi:putative flippase GtrA